MELKTLGTLPKTFPEREALVCNLLLDTKREGIEKLLEFLRVGGYFTAPASTRYHGVYAGGLMAHSLHVYALVEDFDKVFALQTPQESLIIAALLHDVCKMGAYLKCADKPGYYWNKDQPKGHALLSLVRIREFIKLTELETKMIQYHMGIYGLQEFDEKGEYPLRDKGLANAWFHFPIVKLMYFADELAAFLEKN